MKDRVDKSRGIVTRIVEALAKIQPKVNSQIHTTRLCVQNNGQEDYRISLIHVQLVRTVGGNGIFSS